MGDQEGSFQILSCDALFMTLVPFVPNCCKINNGVMLTLVLLAPDQPLLSMALFTHSSVGVYQEGSVLWRMSVFGSSSRSPENFRKKVFRDIWRLIYKTYVRSDLTGSLRGEFNMAVFQLCTRHINTLFWASPVGERLCISLRYAR